MRRADDGGEHEVVRAVDPHRLGECLVLAEGDERAPDPRADEPRGTADRRGPPRRAPGSSTRPCRGSETTGSPGSAIASAGTPGMPERAVGQVHPVDADERDHTGEADGEQHEVGAAQLQREPADDAARQRRAARSAATSPIQGDHSSLTVRSAARIGADAEERGVPERELAGIAEEQVQATARAPRRCRP